MGDHNGQNVRRSDQWDRRGAVKELAVGILGNETLVLGAAGIVMKTKVNLLGHREKPGEQPKGRGDTGHQPAYSP